MERSDWFVLRAYVISMYIQINEYLLPKHSIVPVNFFWKGGKGIKVRDASGYI